MIFLALGGGLAAFLLFAATRCALRVDEGHVSVLTAFGAARRDQAGKVIGLPPGLHTKWPWEKVLTVCVKERSLDLSGEEGGRSAMAADGTVLRFDSILRFVPTEDLEQFLFGMRAPLEHVTALFTCLLRNEIANFHATEATPQSGRELAEVAASGRSPFEQSPVFGVDVSSYAVIRRERRALNERIEEFCRNQIGSRYGVRFAAVDLTDILPPDELADALNAVMQARVEAAAAFARAEGECQQRILGATRGVAVARAQASAAQIEIDGIATHLQQLARDRTLTDYVARRRAEVLAEARTHYVKRGAA